MFFRPDGSPVAHTLLVSTVANPLAEALWCRYLHRGYSSTSSSRRTYSLISVSFLSFHRLDSFFLCLSWFSLSPAAEVKVQHHQPGKLLKLEDMLIYYFHLSSLTFISFPCFSPVFSTLLFSFLSSLVLSYFVSLSAFLLF